jgi:hypothetical protein
MHEYIEDANVIIITRPHPKAYGWFSLFLIPAQLLVVVKLFGLHSDCFNQVAPLRDFSL